MGKKRSNYSGMDDIIASRQVSFQFRKFSASLRRCSSAWAPISLSINSNVNLILQNVDLDARAAVEELAVAFVECPDLVLVPISVSPPPSARGMREAQAICRGQSCAFSSPNPQQFGGHMNEVRQLSSQSSSDGDGLPAIPISMSQGAEDYDLF